MIKRLVKKSGDELFPLGLGAMRFPIKSNSINKELAKEYVYYGIDNGINYIDTAYPYHNGASESFLGEILEGEYREKVKISTKLPSWLVKSRESMDTYLGEQLKNLRTDYIDYYFLHNIDLKNLKRLEKLGVFEFLDSAKAEGKVLNVGFSYHGSSNEFNELIDSYDWDACIVQYNYIDSDYQASYEGIKYAYSKDIAVIVMEPLKGGLLAGNMPEKAEKLFRESNSKSNVEWALDWILNHKEVTCVLSGMGSLKQVKENIAIAKNMEAGSMSDGELAIIDEVKDIMKSMMKINCSACNYCMPCPRGVNIPECFRIYNEKYLFNEKVGFLPKAIVDYMWVVGGLFNKSAEARLCNNCGKCKRHCPQSLDIPTELKTVSKELEGHGFKLKIGLIKSILLPIYIKFSKMNKK